jgi:predicted ATPase with chaperone activity
MLARRLTTILPAMSLAEALETTRLHRVAGRTGTRTAVVTMRPFHAPHHTISDVGRIGGPGAAAGRAIAGAPRDAFVGMHGRRAGATSER